jgi:bis(5'-nucleosyl)-tetraphosphatase (symmetrical)
MYLIGDLQGCADPFEQLLAEIAFSPSRDTLFVLGDLVNRGPASAQVVRRLKALDGAARCVLGNHDLHLLAVAQGVRPAHRLDTLENLLTSPDAPVLLDWLRHQPLALFENEYLMVHAGVLPTWTATLTVALSKEVEAELQGRHWSRFLTHMYGNEPAAWSPQLQGADRLRVIVNALTRLRFCTAQGMMDFDTKEGLHAAPPGFMPWFDVPNRQTADVKVAFGHWSTLGWLGRDDVWALDSGCVWGGCLSALRITADSPPEKIQVPCPQAQKPG